MKKYLVLIMIAAALSAAGFAMEVPKVVDAAHKLVTSGLVCYTNCYPSGCITTCY